MSCAPKEIDVWLDGAGVHRATLAPKRAAPPSFAELFVEIAPSPAVRCELVDGVAALARSITRHYPDNIFWDLAMLVVEMKRRCEQGALELMVAQLTRLMAGFGRESPIRFRYVHDFIYGFDWSKWVRKAPEKRSPCRPFGPEFLDYLEKRQEELVALIAVDDAVYGRLQSGEDRNPFGFSREPGDELRLHRSLAESGDLPVETWNCSGLARYEPDFSEIRAKRAKELGLE